MKVPIFWDIAPCCPYMNRRFGGTYHPPPHLQGRNQPNKKPACYQVARQTLPSQLLAYWFLALLIFDPKDGDDMFLRSVESYTVKRAIFQTSVF
jgi:hypothetical protein